MKPQCCDPYNYAKRIRCGKKTRRKIKINPDNQYHKIKNISAREQLLAELAEREKTLSK